MTENLSHYTKNRLAGDYRPFYVGIAILIVVVVILIALLVKDVPEDAGLYLDGADHPPISEQVDEVKLTLGQILRQKKAWQLIVSFGAYQFIIAACMTGGVPTLHPCITSFAYGRREYQSANRIIMAIQLIPYSFAALMMITLISAGKANLAFGILIVIIIVGIAATLSMIKMKDANEEDRSYGKKKA